MAAPLHEVLLQAAPVLRRLDLKTAFTLNNHIIFEAGVRAQCTALTELHLLSERGITGGRAGGQVAGVGSEGGTAAGWSKQEGRSWQHTACHTSQRCFQACLGLWGAWPPTPPLLCSYTAKCLSALP